MTIMNFNDNWTFIKNEEERIINLPHDAMLEEERCENGSACVGGAYFTGGFYTYVKSFMVPEEFKNNTLFLHVLGAYRKSTVYLNDEKLYYHSYGYTDYMVELTDHLKYGSTNTIKITVDNSQTPNSRWYSGAGLYRGVELILGGKSHFILNELRLNTVSLNPTTLSYNLPHTGDNKLKVEMEIYDGNNLIAKAKGTKGMLNLSVIPWDLDNPKLYDIKLSLIDGFDIIDTYTLSYGFRTIKYTTEGFYLNGIKTIMKGACLHHDNGILGSRSIYDAEVKKLKILKDAGFNAIRSSHNPASSALLKACDDLGILVMDELVDMWLYHKTDYDYAEDFRANYMSDLKSMMDKDYNHPSVVMYSLSNELGSPTIYNPESLNILKNMTEYIHKNDYRPSTMAINFTNLSRPELASHKARYQMDDVYTNSDSIIKEYNDIVVKIGDGMAEIACAKDSDSCTEETFKLMDIAGYNYAYMRYELDDKIHKDRIVCGTETMCKDIYTNYERMKKYPRVVGDFIWTGIDYLGEVGIGGYYSYDHHISQKYPWILANSGAFDLLGFPTGEAMLAGVTYGKYSLKLASYLEDIEETKSAWRWTNSRETYTFGIENVGKKVVVEVYSIYEEVELFINDNSLGKKAIKDGYTTYEFEYELGSIKAIGYDSNIEKETAFLSSAKESHLSLRLDYSGDELTYIYIEYKDENGTIDTIRNDKLCASAIGATILGFGSANPKTKDKYHVGSCHAFLGRAMLAIKKTSKDVLIKVKDDKEEVSIKL